MATTDRSEQRVLQLSGFGVAATAATAVTRHLTARDRMVRAAKAFGLALASALIMLPIPIIHLIGPPVVLLIGLVVAVKRLGQGQIFASAEGECPFCHVTQPLGLRDSRFRLPVDLICRSCRQPLQLESRSDQQSPSLG